MQHEVMAHSGYELSHLEHKLSASVSGNPPSPNKARVDGDVSEKYCGGIYRSQLIHVDDIMELRESQMMAFHKMLVVIRCLTPRFFNSWLTGDGKVSDLTVLQLMLGPCICLHFSTSVNLKLIYDHFFGWLRSRCLLKYTHN